MFSSPKESRFYPAKRLSTSLTYVLKMASPGGTRNLLAWPLARGLWPAQGGKERMARPAGALGVSAAGLGLCRNNCRKKLPPIFTKIDLSVRLFQIFPKWVEGALVSVQIKNRPAAGLTQAAGARDSRRGALPGAGQDLWRLIPAVMPVPVQ